MEEKLSLRSDGLRLAAVLHVPDARKAGQRLPAFIVLHGFVGSKDESHAEIQARMLEGMGADYEQELMELRESLIE